MKYYQPVGEVDTNAAYSNGNLGLGVKGSVPDARAIEHPMREILSAITDAGLTAAEGDLTQLSQAIRLVAPLGPLATAGGTVNAITTNYTPAITLAATRSVRLISAGPNTITNPTFAPNGLTARTITARGGQPLLLGDTGAAGNVCILQYDLTNTRWELLNPVAASLAASNVQVFTTTGTLPGIIVGGSAIINSASATTQTLPAASTVGAGKRIEFLSIGAGIGTVSRAGADTITVNSSTVTSLDLGNGDTLTLESNGTNGWYAVGGSVQLKSSASFASSLATAGYQKLPSGLILQWGAIAVTAANYVLTFPIAFPNAIRTLIGQSVGNNYGGVEEVEVLNPTNSGASIYLINGTGSYSAGTIHWMALGN